MVNARILEKPTRFDRVDHVKKAVGEPVLPGDEQFWILGDPLVLDIDGERFEIPIGYTTDGASVPPWATSVTRWNRWDEPQRWAGIVHDFLYTQPGMTKQRADRAFRSVLASEGAGVFKRAVMYLAVVVGGGPAYKYSQANGPRIYV